MKKLIIPCIILILISGCSSEVRDSAPESAVSSTLTEISSAEWKEISSDDAEKLMKEVTGYIILDVRNEDEFNEGHIPGAVCIPHEEISEKAQSVLLDKSQMIMVYCRSGRRSKIAAKALAEMGYTGIVEFGGIIDWKGEITKD